MINVVGAGIAGSLVTRLLRKAGHKVVVIDDNDTLAGSRASSNLYIASWLKKFGNVGATRGIEVLESLFPAEHIDQPFSRGIGEAMKIRHIAQKHLLVEPDIRGRVMSWDCINLAAPPSLLLDSGQRLDGPIIFCTGYRAPELVDVKVDVLAGHCALYHGTLPPGTSSITMPLPYRHQKLYQFAENQIYFADSTRLMVKSFEKNKVGRMNGFIDKGYEVLRGLGLNDSRLIEYRVGYRPCVKGFDFGQLKMISNQGVFSINSGGKNGLVAYANLAAELIERIGAS